MRFVRARADPPDEVDLDTLERAVSVEGVEMAVLFGSYAADDVRALSDLDVAIRFEQDVDRPRRRRLLDDLSVAIQRTTGAEAVDLVDLDEVGPDLGYEAMAEGVLLHGDREAAIDLEARFMLRALDFRPVKRTWQESLDDRLREGRFGRP